MALGEPVVPQSSFKVTFIASLNASTHASFSGACNTIQWVNYSWCNANYREEDQYYLWYDALAQTSLPKCASDGGDSERTNDEQDDDDHHFLPANNYNGFYYFA